MQLKFKVQSDFRYLPLLTSALRRLGAPAASRATQILVEAFNNAVVHAHNRNSKKWILLDLEWQGGKTTIRVWDRGKGMRPSKQPAKLWQSTGRGLDLIHAMADSVRCFRNKEGHCLEAQCRESNR